MTDAPKQVGPYTITREIGRGGMGVVFLARDTKLDRDVAIKALPEELADDADRMARFEREAKALAALNHPSIASIYGLEEVDGKRYLILEYVPGDTLDQALEHGPMPVSEALPVAKQIAEAIENAHAHGIIHRDLKPANIKFASADSVKVLDFGLAKAFVTESSTVTEIASSPTYIPTNTPTMPGVVMGTAGYLSPEQARGRPVDKRSDIFSFGCVLYEMLAGKTIFPGETVADSLGATLHKDPNWDDLPADTPPTILLLLRRCLTKDRKRRLHDIADARVEIEDAISDPTSSSLNLAGAALAAAGGRSARQGRLTIVVTLILGALIASAVFVLPNLLGTADAPPFVHQLTIAIPREHGVDQVADWLAKVSISRDGTQLVYIGRGAGADSHSNMFLRRLDQPTANVIPNSEDAYAPCFSPDGEWVAYVNDRELKRISIHGGPPSTVCKLDGWVSYIDWGADDTIVFATWSRSAASLMRVPAAGGIPEALTTPDPKNKASHMLPHVLPDGSGVIFSAVNRDDDWDKATILALRYGDSEARTLITGGCDGRYVESGHLVFHREHTLLAAPFDVKKLEVLGPAIPILEDVAASEKGNPAHFDVSDDGTLVYFPDKGLPLQSIVWMDQDGSFEPLSDEKGLFMGAVLSPDGSRVAVTIKKNSDGMRSDIHILERRRNLMRPLVTSSNSESLPIWSPDLKWIVYTSRDSSDSSTTLYRVRADFSGEPELLNAFDGWQTPSHISPDGRTLVFSEYDSANGGSHLYLLRFNDDDEVQGEPEAFLHGPGSQVGARFSADGKWIAYCGYGNRRAAHIFVTAADGTGPSEQVSIEPGFTVRWSPVESRLYYSHWQINQMYSVSYSIEDGVFTPELPEVLFDLGGANGIDSRFELDPDGTRFVIHAPAEDEQSGDPVNPRVILNWFEDIKARSKR